MKLNRKIYLFDPTLKDPLSKTRGLGRYTKILIKALKKAEVIESPKKAKKSSILIFPYLDPLKKPLLPPSLTINIAVIHDVIKLKYPHAFPKGVKAKFFLFLNKIFLKRFHFFITDAEATLPDLEKYLSIPRKKVKVIPPAIDKIFFEEDKENFLSPDLPEKFCLYVGDATYNKNLVNLAKAIKLANITCVFVGKIWEKVKEPEFLKSLNHPELFHLKEFLKEAEGDRRFIFLGFVKDKELVALYKKARFNILISIDEGFGYSPLEAGACKTPSILSNIPVFKETMKDSALFVNPKDPYEIANACLELYFGEKLREELSHKAYKRALEFTLENFSRKLLEFLQSL